MKLRDGWDASLGDPFKGERGGWTGGSDMGRGSAVNLALEAALPERPKVLGWEIAREMVPQVGWAGWEGGRRGFEGERFAYNDAGSLRPPIPATREPFTHLVLHCVRATRQVYQLAETLARRMMVLNGGGCGWGDICGG